MLELEKPVVTADDFKNMFGRDLADMLRDSDNVSNYPNIFLRMVQDFLIEWCKNRTFTSKNLNRLTPAQMKSFQKAVLYHTYYTWKNGALALGLESGVDGERGRILTPEDIQASEVSSFVVGLLHNAGMFNLKMRNRPRYNHGYPGVIGAFTGEDY